MGADSPFATRWISCLCAKRDVSTQRGVRTEDENRTYHRKDVTLKVGVKEPGSPEEGSRPGWLKMLRDRHEVRQQVCDLPDISVSKTEHIKGHSNTHSCSSRIF